MPNATRLKVLFHGLEEYINNLQGDGVIVLHTIGSHGPTCTTAIRRSSGNLPNLQTHTDEIQICSKEQLVNTTTTR
ncbi:hypothetical protein ACLBR5_30445 [Escherichia coli]